ncbi:NB-ARC domain-containing protein [Lentzea sp. NPDC059081]|uniref:NB-ARC domain-containing protein n=1 Tax=Lentzea sp. NPDC059081 TaxID=3346719 RepID=UPI0036C2509C
MPDEPELPWSVRNSVTGDVIGMNVQIGSIGGDLTLHHHSKSRSPGELPLRVGVVPQRAAAFQERVLPEGVAVLSGMGGVGKTQLAAGFAQRQWAEGAVRLLVWVTATSRSAVVSAYAEAAGELTGFDDPEPERAARKFLAWLARGDEPWLVVLDDVRDPADLDGLWPPDTGRVLVTTRRRDTSLRLDERRVAEVGTFSEDEALAYLRSVLAERPALLDGAEELVRALGYLPLALAHAGAYVLDTQLSCARYHAKLGRHRTAVSATWTLSVKQADALPPKRMAGRLLDLLSVLDPNGVPLDVLAGPSVRGHLGGRIDEDGVRDVLATLHRLGLVTLDTGSPSREVRVHALVQQANRDSWKPRHEKKVVRAAADALSERWPLIKQVDDLERAFRDNTEALFAVGGSQLWGRTCHTLAIQLGHSMGLHGQEAQARDHFERLTDTAEHALFGVLAHINFAYWRSRADDAAGACAEFDRVLAHVPRVRPAEQPLLDSFLLSARQQRAELLTDLGEPDRAITDLEELLADTARVHGPDSKEVLSVRQTLLSCRARTGAGDSVAGYEKLTADLVRTLGPEHRQSLNARLKLAAARASSGDLTGSAADLEELVSDYAQVWGPDHPDTLIARGDLADCRGRGGDPARAAAEAEQLAADCLRALGPDHPDTRRVQGLHAFWRNKG